MKFATLAVAAAALGFASVAVAEDDRVLVQYPSQKNFCSKWNATCKAYKPQTAGLTFGYTYCNAGDFHGKNPDTLAKVFCSFKKSDGSLQLVTKHVAAQAGAKIVPSST